MYHIKNFYTKWWLLHIFSLFCCKLLLLSISPFSHGFYAEWYMIHWWRKNNKMIPHCIHTTWLSISHRHVVQVLTFLFNNVLFLVFFETRFLCSFGACHWTSSCRPGWPWIHRDPPALKVRAITAHNALNSQKMSLSLNLGKSQVDEEH